MKNLILVGAPGSGKGTQANMLKGLGFIHISTGDLLRSEVSSGSDLGKQIDGLISRGELVSDNVVGELLSKNLDLNNFHYIFDGYPRNSSQAVILKNILMDKEYSVVYLNSDLEQIKSRIINRRLAPGSGEIYNLLTRPPRNAGVCDISGEVLVHREDDQAVVVDRRFKLFIESRDAILGCFGHDSVFEVDADNSPQFVFDEIVKNCIK